MYVCVYIHTLPLVHVNIRESISKCRVFVSLTTYATSCAHRVASAHRVATCARESGQIFYAGKSHAQDKTAKMHDATQPAVTWLPSPDEVRPSV